MDEREHHMFQPGQTVMVTSKAIDLHPEAALKIGIVDEHPSKLPGHVLVHFLDIEPRVTVACEDLQAVPATAEERADLQAQVSAYRR